MTRLFGFIKYSFCLILSMFFVTSGYAQESSTKDDSIQEVAFSTSWWHEHVSHEVAIRDVRLWGKDEYRYSGKVKIDDFSCKVNFSKKLQYVLRYQNAYFFICQSQFQNVLAHLVKKLFFQRQTIFDASTVIFS